MLKAHIDSSVHIGGTILNPPSTTTKLGNGSCLVQSDSRYELAWCSGNEVISVNAFISYISLIKASLHVLQSCPLRSVLLPGLISCGGMAGRWGLLSHDGKAVRWLPLSIQCTMLCTATFPGHHANFHTVLQKSAMVSAPYMFTEEVV